MTTMKVTEGYNKFCGPAVLSNRTHIRRPNSEFVFCSSDVNQSISYYHMSKYFAANKVIKEHIDRMPEPVCSVCFSLSRQLFHSE